MRGLARLLRSWPSRVAVHGHSMAPSLREGDWLLVDPDGYRARQPQPGELVLAASADGLIVKRMSAVAADGSLLLEGDAPSRDGHHHDASVPPRAVVGLPWFRYWPLRDFGPIH